jgi:hypothetical protein
MGQNESMLRLPQLIPIRQSTRRLAGQISTASWMMRRA